MIMSKKEKIDLDLHSEDPPSYDDASRDYSLQQADDVGTDKSQSHSKHPETARARGPGTSHLAASWKPQSSSATSSSPSWFRHLLKNSAAKANDPPNPKSQADVRNTVLGVIRDLVTGSSSAGSLWTGGGEAAMGMLDSCALACAREQVSFASILQERSVESHTPVYWAIIQRPPLADDQFDGILLKLLALSAPLTEYTVYEMHTACLVVHSNTILQRARSSPAIFPFSGTDYILMHGNDVSASATGFRDIVDVVEGGDDELKEGAFSVNLKLQTFQRRMRVSRQVPVEFITRGRVWSLIFFVVPPSEALAVEDVTNNKVKIPKEAYTAMRMLPKPLAEGTWACCLSLRAGSPQCWVDGRIVVHPRTDIEYSARKTTARNSQPEFNPASGLSVPGTWRGSNLHAGPVEVSSSAHLPSSPLRRLRSSLSMTSLTATLSSAYVSYAGSSRVISPSVITKSPSASGPIPPLTLSLKCTDGALFAPAPPAYETLPLSLVHDPFAEENDKNKRGAGKKSRKQTLKEANKNLTTSIVKQNESADQTEASRDSSATAPTCIVTGLGEGAGRFGDGEGMGKLMYDNCPYIAPDGTLHAKFKAKLGESGSECIIC